MPRAWSRIAIAVVLASSPVAAIAAAATQGETGECRALMETQNYGKAITACTEAAQAGDAAAQFHLSAIYTFGWGVAKNPTEALKWLRASAGQRYPPAEYALASRYAAGSGVPKNGREAVRLLHAAGEQGFLLAQMLLGRAYESGSEWLGIKPDVSTAIEWYTRAAMQCDACQYELWRIYYFGRGVVKDYEKAARYLEKAANAGLPKAQMQLGFRYLDGEGVPKDNVRAYEWFYIAAQAGEPTAAKALPLVAKKMSAPQISEARMLANGAMDKATLDTGQLCQLYQQFCTK